MNQPTTDVYKAAPSAQRVPRPETPPSVPGGTAFPVVIRYVLRESTPISLANVSAPATESADRKITPLATFGSRVGRTRDATATAIKAAPFATTFVARRSPRIPSWTPSACLSEKRYRVAKKLERRKNSRRKSQVTSPKIPITIPTTKAARLPSQVSTFLQ